MSYCSRDCQKLDWSRHGQFCKVAAVIVKRGVLHKDTFAHLIQGVLSNPCLSVLLKSYARDVLKLTRKPQTGLTKNIEFTCTFVEEKVGDLIDLPGAWVLQVLNVKITDFDPATIPGLDVKAEYEKREGFFQNPKETSLQVQHQLGIYRSSQEGPEKDLARRRLAICDVPIVMTFKSDVEGASSPLISVEKLPWAIMLSSVELPQPVLWLLYVTSHYLAYCLLTASIRFQTIQSHCKGRSRK